MSSPTSVQITDVATGIADWVMNGAFELRTEIAWFVLAFFAHAIFMRKSFIFGKDKGNNGNRQARSSMPDEKGGDRKQQSSHKQPPLRNVKKLSGEDICRGNAGKPGAAIARLRARLSDVQEDELEPTLIMLLQSGGRSPLVELLHAVRAVSKEYRLTMNSTLGEVMLRGLYSAHAKEEFEDLLSEIEAESKSRGGSLETALFPGVGVQALKYSLRGSDFQGALSRLDKPRKMWTGLSLVPSAAPKALLQWLVRLALQQDQMPPVVDKLKAMELFSEAYALVLAECAQHGTADDLREMEAIGRKEKLKFTEATYCVLMKAARGVEEAMRLFSEAVCSNGTGKDLVIAASCAASTHVSVIFADTIMKNLPSSPPAEAAGKLLQLYSVCKCDASKFLSLYTQAFASVDLSGDAAAERLIVEACIRSKRLDILKKMLATTSDCTKRVTLLGSLCADQKMDDAFVVFGSFSTKDACLYNAMIHACVEGGKTEQAQKLLEDAVQAGVADSVTYNAIAKAQLVGCNPAGVKKTVQRMRDAGIAPTCETFNDFLEASVKSNIGEVWSLLDEMSVCNLKPNNTTYSILLKTIRFNSSTENVERVLDLLGSSEEMFEALLNSTVEVCIRAEKVVILMPYLKRQCTQRRIQIRGAHTYGSIIRAHGAVNDVEGAWETWREMRSRKIVPTAVALGCFVEAVVSNNDPEGGLALIQDMLTDGDCRLLVNAVIYCSVLKGFSHQKRFDRVWHVYKEMQAHKVTFSIVTFNCMVDACSRCGEMSRISDLLKGMVAQGIQPNLITYSSIIKGYCQENRLDEAFQLKKTMLETTQFKPDEIMYNAFLDGCARQGIYDRGCAVLADMEADGITPSNFTLAMLVKLCVRSKRLERAFEFVQQLSTKYGFKPNVHVYSNLMHGCIQDKGLARAFEVMQTMLSAGIRPDARAYSLLLRACVAAKESHDAVGLVRAALGLKGMQSRLTGYAPSLLQVQGGLPQALITEVVEGIAGAPCYAEQLALDLFHDLRTKPNVKVDPKLHLRLTTKTMNNPRFTSK